LLAQGVELISMKKAVDTGTPQGRCMLTVLGAMATLEQETILQRRNA